MRKLISIIILFAAFTKLSAQTKQLGTAESAKIIVNKMGSWLNGGKTFRDTISTPRYVLPDGLVKNFNVYGFAYFHDVLDSTGKLLSMKLMSLEIYSGSAFRIVDYVPFVFDGEKTAKKKIGISIDSLKTIKLSTETQIIAKWLFEEELKNRTFKMVRRYPLGQNWDHPQPKLKDVNDHFHIVSFNNHLSPTTRIRTLNKD